MKITLDQWLAMEQFAKAADTALQQLHTIVTNLVLDYHREGHKMETELLKRIESRVFEAQQTLGSHLFFVQDEWTGGDSSKPRNFTLREPNWVTISHSFPKEQVDKYRRPNGEIVLPTRQKKEQG